MVVGPGEQPFDAVDRLRELGEPENAAVALDGVQMTIQRVALGRGERVERKRLCTQFDQLAGFVGEAPESRWTLCGTPDALHALRLPPSLRLAHQRLRLVGDEQEYAFQVARFVVQGSIAEAEVALAPLRVLQLDGLREEHDVVLERREETVVPLEQQLDRTVHGGGIRAAHATKEVAQVRHGLPVRNQLPERLRALPRH
ncbi:MAG: hypothetical protein AAF211_33325, partial [Myxococcota bacterium]